MTQLVVFQTNVYDRPVADRFLKLYRELNGVADVVALIDGRFPDVIDRWRYLADTVGACVQVFDINQMPLPFYAYGDVMMGNTHWPLMMLSQSLPYDYYWMVEHDVEYTGNWSDLVASFLHRDDDLVTAHIERVVDNPLWHWWDTAYIVADRDSWVKGLLPIARYSKAACDAVISKHRDGWVAHFEVLVPTAVATSGLVVTDLNDVVQCYVPGNQEPHLQPHSSIRWRPPITPNELNLANTLVHPVK